MKVLKQVGSSYNQHLAKKLSAFQLCQHVIKTGLSLFGRKTM